MQKFSQKYTIAVLLEPMSVGDEFRAPDWPQHVTLANVFAIDWQTAKQKLAAIASKQKIFSVDIVGQTYFGDNKDVHVLLCEKSPEIVNLHERVVAALEADGARFNVPEYIHTGFVPHSTVRDSTKLQVGDSIIIDNLAVIDMFPNSDPYNRRITDIFRLMEGKSE